MILLENIDTEFGRIKIIHSENDGTYSYYQDTCLQSRMGPGGVSICAYVHVMQSIIRQSGARDVLMLGGAGGTLATMLHRLGCKVTVVDINPHAFRLAKKYFQMPQEIECIVEDGWAFLQQTKNRYDALAIDVFSSDETVPEIFTTQEFFILAKAVLSPPGVIAMNVMVKQEEDELLADRVALNMESAGIPTALFDWPGRAIRNTIIAGGALKQPQLALHKAPQVIGKKLQGMVRRTAKFA